MQIAPSKAESARSTGLALALDDGTRKSHSMAESTQFVTGFFKGLSSREAFSQLVASLYFVYEAMERAFDECEDPQVKALDYPELRRVPSLEKDMAYYFGDNWRSEVKPSPAAREYVDRILAIPKSSTPELLIAHQYTRYLGDLFGGQMMGGMARSSLKLDKNSGTCFYEFDDIPNNKAFIEGWYAKLNSLPLTAAQQQAIIDESNAVYALNIKVFDELKGRKRDVVRTMAELAFKALKENVSSRVSSRRAGNPAMSYEVSGKKDLPKGYKDNVARMTKEEKRQAEIECNERGAMSEEQCKIVSWGP
jgi:heme oxygenase